MMNIVINSNTQNYNSQLPEKFAFLCFASFEDRCLTIPNSIKCKEKKRFYIFYNKDLESKITDNIDAIGNGVETLHKKGMDLNNPVDNSDELYGVISEVKNDGYKSIVIDITTFTHEIMLMLIKTLYLEKNNFDNIIFLYNNALEYSDWLSKGCREVRNVVGYPGVFKPSNKYNLIILTGFEKERATRLVELLEPDQVTLGLGCEPTVSTHKEFMENMKSEFSVWSDNLQTVSKHKFEFSCKNIEKTINQLEEILIKHPKQNYIIVPLNTKLSTIATGLFALRHKEIQLCYTIPETYNHSYSKSSEEIAVVDMKKMFDLI